ncbi:Contactin-3 [Merluccius polli]|uniref:Contactin-3 n=1 Tax=Merluccius polli TaxID=89951 RepID=A0AA47MBM5_MERPO|nr:Contactin-3 [Merluccius polli]
MASNKWGSLLSHKASLQFAYLENFKTQTVRSAVNVREGQGVVFALVDLLHILESWTFAWIFNEYPYFVQQGHSSVYIPGDRSLYIAKVESSDVGNYTCVVNNTITREKVLRSAHSLETNHGVPFPGKVKMRNSNAVLEIVNFQQEDTGTYECVAENSRGKNTARGRLSFHAKPHWLQTITDTALSIEENLFWECKANGKA